MRIIPFFKYISKFVNSKIITMKKIITILIFLAATSIYAQTTITPEVVSQFNCDPSTVIPVGDPYIENSFCEEGLGVAKYLAKAAAYEDLASLIDHEFQIDCTAPYDSDQNPTVWEGKRCPQKYAEQIKAAVQMDIRFIARAAKIYRREAAFTPSNSNNLPGNSWVAQEQFIKDVHYAYDCASKRRPIIQATIIEYVDGNVGYVKASQQLLFDFFKYYANTGITDLLVPTRMLTQTFINSIQNSNCIDGDNVNFTCLNQQLNLSDFKLDYRFNNSIYSGANNQAVYMADANGLLDITQIETQLYFYFVIKSYIDMGYTAIHMGQFKKYGRHEEFDYPRLKALFDHFRQYALNNNSFVLFNGESGNALVGPNYDTFLFDFSTVGAWFREIDTPSNSGGIDDCPGSTTDNTIYEEGTPCDGELLKAVIDQCVIEQKLGDLSGISPTSGCYVENLPFFITYDFGHGSTYDDPPCVLNESASYGSGEAIGTYGYDDATYLATILSSECRAYFYEYYYCEFREMFTNGFLAAPGQMLLAGVICEEPDPDTIVNYPGLYMISDEPSFVQKVANTNSTLAPSITIEEHCEMLPGKCLRNCNGNLAPSGYMYEIGVNRVCVNIDNQDCSSIYSVHIQTPVGSWFPATFGQNTFCFDAPIDGTYNISVRQDNLTLPQGEFPLDVVAEYDYTIEGGRCCELVLEDDCFGVNVGFQCSNSDGELFIQLDYNPSEMIVELYENESTPLNSYLINGNILTGTLDTDLIVNQPLFIKSRISNSTESYNDFFVVNPDCDLQLNSRDKKSDNKHQFSVTPSLLYANQELNIYSNNVHARKIQIFDSKGQIVYSFDLTTEENNFVTIPNYVFKQSGIYFISEIGQDILTKKISVIKN